MNKQELFWASNLKLLRARKKIGQEELAEKLGIKRAKLHSLESGATQNPTMADLVNFSTFFKMSVDTMMKVNLTKLSERSIRALEAGNDVYVTGANIRVLATTVDKENNEHGQYVPIKAKAGYAGGYADPEYIGQLPTFSLPQLPANRTYRMFPTTGDSMLPIPENSYIVGEFVEDWTDLKNDSLCIVILKNSGADFVFKQIENHIADSRTLILKSLNTSYDPYTVAVEDVLELWKWKSYLSDTVPAGNITMEQICTTLKDIKVTVDGIAGK